MMLGPFSLAILKTFKGIFGNAVDFKKCLDLHIHGVLKFIIQTLRIGSLYP